MPRLITLLTFIAFASGAIAQNPAQPALPVPVPAPNAPVPLPNAAPASIAPPIVNAQPPAMQPPMTQPAGAQQGTTKLQFPNSDLGQVLDFYERLSHRRLIRDSQLAGQLNIVVNEDIPVSEALKIIEINLMMNQITLAPVAGTNYKLWKVIGNGRNPRNFGIPILSNVEDLDQYLETEQVVTFLAKIQYADPLELAQTLGQAVPAGQNLGQTITPLPKAGALLITENTTIIRGILQIIHEVDLPPAEVVSEFFALERADSKDVLEKLQDIIQPKSQSGTTTTPNPAVPRPNQPRNPNVTPEGVPLPPTATVEQTAPGTIEVNSGRVLSEDAVVVGKTILQADARTNRIHIVTRPVNLKFFRKLIDQLDATTVFGEPVTRPLKFVSAGDIIEALKKAISDPGAKDEGGGGTAAGTRPGQTNRGSTGSQQNLFENNRNSLNGSNGLGGGGGTGGFSESLSAEERDVAPEAFNVGNTKIIADKRSNKIIVIGNKDIQQKVLAFLDKIDVRAPQVMIRTVIGTLSLNNDETFGFDYILRKGSNLGTTTTTTGTGTGATTTTTSNLVVNPGALNNPGGSSVSSGTNLANLLTQAAVTQIATGGASGFSGFFTAGNALDIITSALQSSSHFRVNASPTIFTSNNKKAVISSGTEIAVPTSTLSSGTGVSTTGTLNQQSNIQFKTIALQLEVLPLINADGEVYLEIVQKIDEQDGTTKIDNNDIPRIATRSLKTAITIPNGATLVLGGLRRESETKSKAGIPYLSKIPGLGALFRNSSTKKTRDELVILMRPVVTVNPREAINERERTLDGFMMEPDLESGLSPDGIRKRVPPDETFRKGSPGLREDSATPAPKGGAKKK